MLFSSSEVADYINANFEAAWESVRPAPMVTIDFGDGHVIRRTLHGNIATYICSPEGFVYDVLPGIYSPKPYREQLEVLKVLAESMRPKGGATPTSRRAKRELAYRLRVYHEQQTALLARTPPTPQMQSIALTGGGFKGGGFSAFGGVGGNLGSYGGFGGTGLLGGQPTFGNFSGIEGPTVRAIAGLPPSPAPAQAGPLAERPELALDAQVNESVRRKAVHEHLARVGAVRPDDIKKWLFKEVLHADLDDPTLGLGAALNANYPFAEEDRAASKR